MIEKRHRIDDALEAVRSAQEMGIVAGGGATLIQAVSNLTVETDNADQDLGVEIIKESVEAPLRQMAINAGLSPDLIVQMVKDNSKPDEGYNFVTERIENLFEAGVIDPVKVTTSALENAVSVASTLITTNHAIIKA